MTSAEHPIPDFGGPSPDYPGDALFMPLLSAERQAALREKRTAENRLQDRLTAGSRAENADDIAVWLASLRDPSVWRSYDPRTVPYYTTKNLFRRLGIIDASALDGVSTASQLALYYNEPFPDDQQPPNNWVQFRHNLTKHAVEVFGDMGSAQRYRLLFLTGVLEDPTEPHRQAAHNFLSLTDKVNEPLEMAEVVAHLGVPVTRQNKPVFSAIATFLEQTDESAKLDDPVKMISSSVDTTLNLLAFVDTETKKARGDTAASASPTNAARMLHAIKQRRGKVVYQGLERTTGVTATPYSALLRLANQVCANRQELNEPLPLLQEDTIEDLPRAIDRIIDIAVNFGESAQAMSRDTEFRETIVAVRAAVDEIVARATQAKLRQPVFTVADAVVTLRAYLPPEEAAYAVQYIARGEPLPAMGAHHRRVQSTYRWYEGYLQRPGYGRLS